jgi:hypothetical protein
MDFAAAVSDGRVVEQRRRMSSLLFKYCGIAGPRSED